MSGNISEFYDPANAYGRNNCYPSSFYAGDGANAEPSFRSRKIYVPINAWFMLNSRCSFPLVALQYNELYINVTIRPIQELIQVRDVFDYGNFFPYVQPDFTQPQFSMYRYLQQPPGVNIESTQYQNQTTTWNADVHLIATYGFLSEEERKKIALEDQVYLVKDIFEYKFENIVGSKTVSLTSNGMIANWMWVFQRNDVNLRNEWSNYTNCTLSRGAKRYFTSFFKSHNSKWRTVYYNRTRRKPLLYRTRINPPNLGTVVGNNTGLYTTGVFSQDNVRDIMVTMGINLNGVYRENVLPSEVYNFVEQYARSNGSGNRGLYCYNFCLNTSPFEYQPSGAMNLSRFKDINLEVTTVVPIISLLNANYQIICDLSGNPIGVNKQNWRLYDYAFNMTVYEERYNILSIIGGNCGMLYAR